MIEFVDRGPEVVDREIGPTFGEKDEFGEGAFPKKEVGEALLAPGTDEEVDVSGPAAQHFGEDAAERFLGEFGDFVEAAGGAVDGVARGIVDGKAQMQAGSMSGGGFGVDNGLAEGGGDAVAAADDAEADALVDAVRGFG